MIYIKVTTVKEIGNVHSNFVQALFKGGEQIVSKMTKSAASCCEGNVSGFEGNTPSIITCDL